MRSENIETISQRSVCQFIENEHTSGALLVTGEWGSGKTHFLKQLAEKYNKQKYAIAHISLFGRDSSEEIEHDIKKELCYLFATTNISGEDTESIEHAGDKSRKINKFRKGLNEKETVTKLIRGLRVITDHFKEDSKIIGEIDSLINFNYWDFIDLDTEILGKRIVIIFDDFERCTIEPDLLLGIINEYSENIGMKVIIVANDDQIKNPKKFTEYKEKVVYKTVKLEQNIEYVLKTLIQEFNKNNSEYQHYLEDHLQLIVQVFNASTYNNFRSLRTAINDFEKLYTLFVKKTQFLACHKLEQYEEKALAFLTEQFFAFTMETSAGEDIYEYFFDMFTTPIDKNNDGTPIYLEYSADNIPLYTSKYSQEIFYINSAPKAIVEWVTKGIYNEESIAKCIDAYIEKYKPHKTTDLELFLSTQILFLDSIENFNNGYMEALNKAYTGDLTSEQYLSLLHQICDAKELRLDLPEEPKYDKMTIGFEMKDRSNEEEPVLGGFSGWAEGTAAVLKKEIETSIHNRLANKRIKDYYNYCLNYFNDCNTNMSLHFNYSEKIQIDFNDELMDAVVNSFKKATNKKRREISSCFLHIMFSNYKDRTLSNKLIQKLTALQGNDINDPIEIANLNTFIREAKQRFLLDEN
ncbi:MAG: KAP family NTPase [Oscillospiraceae bacterium]|nr:KAP family NTPase [Oscillospiraceae bacterium]